MIGLNDFVRQWEEIGSDVHSAIERAGASGWYVLGEEVRMLERALARFWGARWCVGVGNGHDAIEIGLRSLGIRPGELVLTTPISAFASTSAIIRAGGVPVFVDTDETGLLDLGRCRRVLGSNHSIRFMLPVHLYGRVLDLDCLGSLNEDFNLRIVEDCAQSIGARWGKRRVGTVGQVAAVSFYPTKNLGALGDGGAVLTSSRRVRNAAIALRNYGQTARDVHGLLGLNSRLDELQAAILIEAQLPRLEGWLERRRLIAQAYSEGIHHRQILVPAVPTAACPSWHLFPVRVPGAHREGFREHLVRCGVATGVHYPKLIPEQKALDGYPVVIVDGDLNNASRLVREEVSLPIHPFLREGEVSTVIEACNRWRP